MLHSQFSSFPKLLQLGIGYDKRAGVLNTCVMFDEGVLPCAQYASLIIFVGSGYEQYDHNIPAIKQWIGNYRPQVIVKIRQKKSIASFHPQAAPKRRAAAASASVSKASLSLSSSMPVALRISSMGMALQAPFLG